MITTIDFRGLDARFRTSLVFATFEGLLDGQALRVISDIEPLELATQFQEANIKNAEWQFAQTGLNTWQMNIYKVNKEKVGCCGMCGTHP